MDLSRSREGREARDQLIDVANLFVDPQRFQVKHSGQPARVNCSERRSATDQAAGCAMAVSANRTLVRSVGITETSVALLVLMRDGPSLSFGWGT